MEEPAHELSGPEEDQDREHGAYDRRDHRGAADHAPDASALPLADVDRDEPDRGHVHPETGRGAPDERELRRERHDRERAGALRARDDDVRPEAREDEHGEAGDVLPGPGEDREVVAERALRERVADGSADALGLR